MDRKVYFQRTLLGFQTKQQNQFNKDVVADASPVLKSGDMILYKRNDVCLWLDQRKTGSVKLFKKWIHTGEASGTHVGVSKKQGK